MIEVQIISIPYSYMCIVILPCRSYQHTSYLTPVKLYTMLEYHQKCIFLPQASKLNLLVSNFMKVVKTYCWLGSFLTHVATPSVTCQKKRYDVLQLQSEIPSFVRHDKSSLVSQIAKGMFCKSKSRDVALLCICHSPWIEGTTSKAIYGDKQKEFNVHNCVLNATIGFICTA